jgi:hypothetical protein
LDRPRPDNLTPPSLAHNVSEDEDEQGQTHHGRNGPDPARRRPRALHRGQTPGPHRGHLGEPAGERGYPQRVERCAPEKEQRPRSPRPGRSGASPCLRLLATGRRSCAEVKPDDVVKDGQDLAEAQRRHWQDAYAAHPGMYGEEPSAPAAHVAGVFQRSGATEVLELGAGHGRDALYFAREGFTVRATDFSATGLDQPRLRTAEAGVRSPPASRVSGTRSG